MCVHVREREGEQEREGEREGVYIYVRKIGTYLCFSMADNLGWVEHVGVGGACGGGWSMQGWVEHIWEGV